MYTRASTHANTHSLTREDYTVVHGQKLSVAKAGRPRSPISKLDTTTRRKKHEGVTNGLFEEIPVHSPCHPVNQVLCRRCGGSIS